MNIQTGTPSYQSALRQTLSVTDRPSFASVESAPAAPADSVVLGSQTKDIRFDLGDAITWGAIGAVPALGAVSNFTIGAVTAVAGQKSQSSAAFWGMTANVLGTGALVTGLLIGSNTTTMAGAGLLVGSGLAGAYGAGRGD